MKSTGVVRVVLQGGPFHGQTQTFDDKVDRCSIPHDDMFAVYERSGWFHHFEYQIKKPAGVGPWTKEQAGHV